MSSLRNVMIAGTGSDVGKSLIAAGLCRIFADDGYAPAPFKAQNMALNSAATPDGREIGRAQAAQAEAARLAPEVDMNPLLLKPSGEHTSQVVLLGRPIGNRDAYQWYRHEGRDELRREVNAAFHRLASRFNPIVLEGAGSIAELNLADSDLVNMAMAREADADIFLVADIDRGGVFASVYGSIMLQKPADRERIKGVIINKFRGDKRLFDDGCRMLEEICGVPVLGVVPMATDIHIDEEDSVALAGKRRHPSDDGRINAAIILLPRISNFTDFGPLERDSRFCAFYTADPAAVAEADIVIIPGSKATLSDLAWLRSRGLDAAIARAATSGRMVAGICGGFQMMGRAVADPDGIEGPAAEAPGLGLLDCTTVLSPAKTTCRTEFTFRGIPCHGYEIHQGVTTAAPDTKPLVALADGRPEGVTAGEMVWGTYLHGILDNRVVRDHIARLCRPGQYTESASEPDPADEYDRLADHLRRNLDIDLIYRILKRQQQ